MAHQQEKKCSHTEFKEKMQDTRKKAEQAGGVASAGMLVDPHNHLSTPMLAITGGIAAFTHVAEFVADNICDCKK